MDRTARLSLPYLSPSQAQKHVTLNEALTALDALVQLTVASRTLPLAPEPSDGTCQIVPDGEPSAGHIAQFADGNWRVISPAAGWRTWILDEDRLAVFNGNHWEVQSVPETVARLGISATPDDTNRLAIAAAASLFSHAGSDHRLIVNRQGGGDTASLLLQSGWSGRAEIGLAGDDNLSAKVSPDGTNWRAALAIDAASGRVDCPNGLNGAFFGANLLINAGFKVDQRRQNLASLNTGVFGHDRWRATVAGTVYTVIDAGVRVDAGGLEQVCDVQLRAGTPVTFSAVVTGAAGTVTCMGQSFNIGPADGRVSVTFSGAPSDSDTLAIQISGAGAEFREMKLEVGAHATAFVARNDAEEFALCLFYYEQVGPGPGRYNSCGSLTVIGANLLSGFIPYAPKRRRPTITFSGAFQCLGQSISSSSIVSMFSFAAADRGFEARINVDRTLQTGTSAVLRTEDDPDAYIAIDAEH